MKVEMNLYASLKRYVPDKSGGTSCKAEVDRGTTIVELLNEMKLPLDEIKIIFLNGRHAKGDEILKEGDRVGVFPPVAGG